jgi:NAD-dependent dihydropyrimidine dehydrogenase PreA subunit
MSCHLDVLPWVIPERCEGCSSCVGACRRQLLVMIETEPGVFMPWLDDVDRCTGCGLCEAACAWAAICLTSYVDEARAHFLRYRPSGIATGLGTETEQPLSP